MLIIQLPHSSGGCPSRIQEARLSARTVIVAWTILERFVTETFYERLVKGRTPWDIARRSFIKWESTLNPCAMLQLIPGYKWKVFCSVACVS